MYNNETQIGLLTVAELIELIDNQLNKRGGDVLKPQQKKYYYGISGIAELLHCSLATANRIKGSGVIDKAISQVGKIIIVDAELALQLINNQQGRRLR